MFALAPKQLKSALQGFRNPVRVARAVMQHTPHVLLAGEGAALFAAEQGMEAIGDELIATRYDEIAFAPGDAFLFGPETRGLPEDVLTSLPDGQRLRLPMRPGNRSLNLSNAVAVVVFEAWRQQGFAGAAS